MDIQHGSILKKGLITLIIGCMFQKKVFPLVLCTFFFFHDLKHVISSGADNSRGQNFDVNRNLVSLRSFVANIKKISL